MKEKILNYINENWITIFLGSISVLATILLVYGTVELYYGKIPFENTDFLWMKI